MEITKITNCKNKYFRATWVELDKDGEVNTDTRYYLLLVLFEKLELLISIKKNVLYFLRLLTSCGGSITNKQKGGATRP